MWYQVCDRHAYVEAVECLHFLWAHGHDLDYNDHCPKDDIIGNFGDNIMIPLYHEVTPVTSNQLPYRWHPVLGANTGPLPSLRMVNHHSSFADAKSSSPGSFQIHWPIVRLSLASFLSNLLRFRLTNIWSAKTNSFHLLLFVVIYFDLIDLILYLFGLFFLQVAQWRGSP